MELGKHIMKIKDVISEGPFDFLQKLKAARAGAQRHQSNREKTASAVSQQAQAQAQVQAQAQQAQDQSAQTAPRTEPAEPPPNEPAVDIKDTLPDDQTQYRFAWPEDPTIDIIIRKTGYFMNKLPQDLRGAVKKDRATGLYPVLKADNIKKLNQYYDSLANRGRVKEEPVHAL